MTKTLTPKSGPSEDRFIGCLLGLAIGDALGGLFEAQSPNHLRSRFDNVDTLIDYPTEQLTYTDDTQMTIGVAETLVEHGEILEEKLCHAFVNNYLPSRGYGRGARRILDAMEDGRDYTAVAETVFPGGSYGNGAAMRVAPVGLLFHSDRDRVQEQARLSAWPTHKHPLGIVGAQLLACAVAICIDADEIDRDYFSQQLTACCQSREFEQKLAIAATVTSPEGLGQLGNGIQALESVVTSITSFLLTPNSYAETVANVIFLGGDTDTTAAMAGALSGAYLGTEGIPKRLIDLLEDWNKGKTYLRELGQKLWARFAQT
ncbi:MAG: ADP-ribosylglycohydrolase family protein [Gemmataceae bacterium]